MMKAERQELILKHIADNGRVVVTDFAKKMESPRPPCARTFRNWTTGALYSAYMAARLNRIRNSAVSKTASISGRTPKSDLPHWQWTRSAKTA